MLGYKLFEKLFMSKFELYFTMYVAEQLAASFAVDIVNYINDQNYDKTKFDKLGLKTHYDSYINKYEIYLDSVKTEVNNCCLNIDLKGYNDIDIYHLHSDEILYAILHYDKEFDRIKRFIARAFK